MKTQACLITCALLLGSLLSGSSGRAEERSAPFNGRGERVGEVTSTSAIVHTHLTATPELVGSGRNRRYESVPGYARVEYTTQSDFSRSKKSEWKEAREQNDCCLQFHLTGLQPHTVYYYRVHTADLVRQATRVCAPGGFCTAPAPEVEAEISFVAITGQSYHRRRQPPKIIKAYDGMLKVRPDFYVSTGDNVYYDKNDPRIQREGTASETLATCRLHWQRMFGWPNLKAFFARVTGSVSITRDGSFSTGSEKTTSGISSSSAVTCTASSTPLMRPATTSLPAAPSAPHPLVGSRQNRGNSLTENAPIAEMKTASCGWYAIANKYSSASAMSQATWFVATSKRITNKPATPHQQRRLTFSTAAEVARARGE